MILMNQRENIYIDLNRKAFLSNCCNLMIWTTIIIGLYAIPSFEFSNALNTNPDLRSHRASIIKRSSSNALCKDIYCPKNQVCKIVDGFFPICSCKSSCKIHHGKGAICGSDGRWYANRCELHRQSCNSGIDIKILPKHKCGDASEPFKHTKDNKKYTHIITKLNQTPNETESYKNRPNLSLIKYDIEAMTPKPKQLDNIASREIKYQDLKSIINDDKDIFEDDIDESKKIKPENSTQRSNFAIVVNKHKRIGNISSLHVNHLKINRLYSNQTNLSASKSMKRDIDVIDSQIDNSFVLLEKFKVFKNQLKNFYKDQYIDANDPFINEDPYAVNLMFGTMDINNDNSIAANELTLFYDRWSEFEMGLNELNDKTFDILELLEKYDDNGDSKLDAQEFYMAFDLKLPNISHTLLPTLYEKVRIGSNVKLTCNAKYLSPGSVIWKRYGSPLNNRELQNVKIFSDGSLYIVGIQPYLSGNYSYELAENKIVYQTYIVTVLTNPTIRIQPKRSQLARPGSTVTIKCRALSYPPPSEVLWFKNNIPIPLRIYNETAIAKIENSTSIEPMKNYHFNSNRTILSITDIHYFDTGAYTCQFESEIESVKAHSDIFVVEDDSINVDFEEQKHANKVDLLVFDDGGVKVYDASSCQIRERIRPDLKLKMWDQYHMSDLKFNSDNEVVCNERGTERCHWGPSINVRNKFLYIIEKGMSGILVFDLSTHAFKEKIMTDLNPQTLKYIHSHDQIWVVCQPDAGLNKSQTGKTIQVIRLASKPVAHDIMHTEPIQGKFDQVENLFVPESAEDLSIKPKYGYTIHSTKMYMYKLDLELLRYESLVDLSAYKCIPKDVAFYIYGGFVFVRCINLAGYDKGQIILDYLVDTVIGFDSGIHGVPYVSPDQSYVASVDSVTRIVKFQKLNQAGVKYLFDIVAPINPTSSIFHLSFTFGTYDFIFASNQQTGIVFFNVYNHQSFDIINEYSLHDYRNELNSEVEMTSSGPFGDYIALVKGSIIIIVDAKRKRIHCQINESSGSNLTIQWVHT